MAEPWKIIVGEVIQEARFLELRADYALGTCPVKPRFITIAADVQRDCIYYTVRAWGDGAESWLVDYGKAPRLEDLNEVFARQYNIAGSDEMAKPFKGMIDSGFNAQAVYEFCIASGGQFVPAKGWASLAQPVKQAMIVYESRHGASRHIELFHFDDGSFKTELYMRRIQDRQGPPWHIPRNIGPDYITQLTAERLVEKRNSRGVPEQVWIIGRQENHLGDCEKMQLVQGYLMGGELKKPAPGPATPSPQPAQAPAMIPRMPRQGGWVTGWK